MAFDSVLQAASRADYGFQNIPVIDMKDLDSPDPILRHQLARDIRDACINVGFFYVKNHGIPEGEILKAVNAGKNFFSLPIETKMKYDSRNSTNFKGYAPLLSENNDPENRGDLHESFDIGPEDKEGTKSSAMSGANQWPTDEIPEFKDDYLGYYRSSIAFGKKLFPLFAIALDLPENFFDDKTQEDAAIMRVLHYPPQTGVHDDRVLGIGAHTDFECFTMLWQEPDVQALQVLNANKQWVNATPIPGTLVINIGDQLSRWTNDVFKSTFHRAINRTGVERYSMPVFFGVDYNVRLEPIPSCVSPEHPPKYEVVTAGEHVAARLAAAYSGPRYEEK
ncbi:Clavaminate synthase [Pyrrhoderma noxium]|uniref:Clavaminate synthase n=1 Tax=Pyrrhoderma noxium TaxID=2282107 RepID=A0A286UBS9_9AGAM|nr:Clavaminate synthase [Pyrrhoderma noxium]